jgi:hypothetical protein
MSAFDFCNLGVEVAKGQMQLLIVQLLVDCIQPTLPSRYWPLL